VAGRARREKSFVRRDGSTVARPSRCPPPRTWRTWLEYAKVEEERGHFARCHKILTADLHYCPYHEVPMLEALKHLERMGKLDKVRSC
jgi:hypothetical protein